MRSAIERLSETYRTIIRLRYVDQLKHREIAARLNTTMGYVGNTLSRGEQELIDKVRKLCGDHLGPFEGAFRQRHGD